MKTHFLTSETVPLDSIRIDEATSPAEDEELLRQMDLVYEGKIEAYWGKIPLRLITPFEEDYVLRLRPVHLDLIKVVVGEIRNKILRPLLVYPKAGRFIMSDDYPFYYAYLLERMPFALCTILGPADNLADVSEVEGPLTSQEIRDAFGISA